MSFIDDFSRFTWIYFLKNKSDVCQAFTLFKTLVENLLSTTIMILRIDGGTEFKPITTKFPQILHQTTCPHTPQQNGMAERKHRHIVELALANVSHALIPLQFWDEVFSSVVYLINRMPFNNSVPYKALLNKDPDYHFLRVLGCACYPLTRPYNNNKLELRSKECVFIGYGITQKGYRCLHIPTNRIYVSRSVQFDETSFPFKNLPLQSKHDSSASSSQLQVIPSVFPPSIQIHNNTGPLIQPQRPIEYQAQPNCSSTDPQNSTAENASSSNEVSTASPQAPAVPLPEEYFIQLVQPNSHTMVTRTKDRTYKKKEFPEFVTFHTSIEPYPTTFLQANKTPHWCHAMAAEIEALANNQTWTLVLHPQNQKVIGCKWVFKTKKKSNGSIERYKARLVAKGFDQVSGIDFKETYSPVVRPAIIWVTISLALSFNWDMRQLDVSNAFLNGDLTKTVYMT